MLELMYRYEGLGLAANQVALDARMIVINFEGDAKKSEQQVVAINPIVIEERGTISDREGCLSFPGLYQNIRRAQTVKVQYYTLDGDAKEMECSDLSARIWLHEIDHLNGKLYIDKMGMLARRSSRKDLEVLIAEFDEGQKKGTIDPTLEKKL